MNLFANLKTKKTKRLENPIVSSIQTIPENDVALLAMMCKMCRLVTLKRYFITRVYAYYVPQVESDLPIAQKIFARNGIQMNVHYSHICGEGQDVLRIDCTSCNDNNKLAEEMERIEQKYYFLYMPNTSVAEKSNLWHQVLELRQKQK